MLNKNQVKKAIDNYIYLTAHTSKRLKELFVYAYSNDYNHPIIGVSINALIEYENKKKRKRTKFITNSGDYEYKQKIKEIITALEKREPETMNFYYKLCGKEFVDRVIDNGLWSYWSKSMIGKYFLTLPDWEYIFDFTLNDLKNQIFHKLNNIWHKSLKAQNKEKVLMLEVKITEYDTSDDRNKLWYFKQIFK